eukprot:scaffold285_cov330-Pavlova_lutheri.AAC.23
MPTFSLRVVAMVSRWKPEAQSDRRPKRRSTKSTMFASPCPVETHLPLQQSPTVHQRWQR